MNEDFLKRKLDRRRDEQSLRSLPASLDGIDFCSNDYLGIVKNRMLKINAADETSGSTGSRLISGNYRLLEEVEAQLADFHHAESGLLYNSGYDANIGLLSCVPQRDDTVLYDYLSHASIRDGIRLSMATAHSFRHNDLEDLEKKLTVAAGTVFVVTESVFSMDGDKAPLVEMVALCDRFGAKLIIDEAHATGIVGSKGEGLVQMLDVQARCFARVHTFGKAVGCHGAVVLGSRTLRDYLVNFSRPFIYTTALPEPSVHAISKGYALFPQMSAERGTLDNLITIFSRERTKLPLAASDTPIQALIIPGNERVRAIAAALQQRGFHIKPILYPTVPRGRERLRIVLHAFNSAEEVTSLIASLREFCDLQSQEMNSRFET